MQADATANTLWSFTNSMKLTCHRGSQAGNLTLTLIHFTGRTDSGIHTCWSSRQRSHCLSIQLIHQLCFVATDASTQCSIASPSHRSAAGFTSITIHHWNHFTVAQNLLGSPALLLCTRYSSLIYCGTRIQQSHTFVALSVHH